MKAAPAFASRKFPKGSYWITDPCYLYPDGEWQNFCHNLSSSRSGVYDHSDISFFAWGTAWGDGIYPVMEKIKGVVTDIGVAGVDSGMLAIIPHELVVKWGSLEEAEDLKKRLLATKIQAKRSFTVDEQDGDVFFGQFCVDTSGFTCEDEEDEE